MIPKSVRKLAGIALLLIALLYVLGYICYRYTHTEVWPRDGKSYVIFPKDSRWLYLAFRPLAYADGFATGMGFHIGPHE